MKATVDDILRTLEEFLALEKDEPIIIEQVDECGDGYRHYFDSIYDVRRSREYQGDTWEGLDPVIWYDDEVYSMYRDPEAGNTFVIELVDKGV